MLRSRLTLSDLLQPEELIAIDIGARAHILPVLDSLASRSRIFAFEADAVEARRLEQMSSPYLDLKVHPYAIYSSDGDQTLYQHQLPVFGSLLPHKEGVWHALGWETETRQKVSTRSLASLVAAGDIPSEVDLIKIDAQGAGVEILKGAGSLLDSVLAVEVEVGVIERYVGEGLIGEVIPLLSQKGLELASLWTVPEGGPMIDNEDFLSMTVLSRRRVSHADLLFFRDPAPLAGDLRTLRRLTVLHLAYGLQQRALAAARLCGDTGFICQVKEYVRSTNEVTLAWRLRVAGRALRCALRPSCRARFALAREALTVHRGKDPDFLMSPPRL